MKWMCGVPLKEKERFVLSFGYSECGLCGEAWQIEIVLKKKIQTSDLLLYLPVRLSRV